MSKNYQNWKANLIKKGIKSERERIWGMVKKEIGLYITCNLQNCGKCRAMESLLKYLEL